MLLDPVSSRLYLVAEAQAFRIRQVDLGLTRLMQ